MHASRPAPLVEERRTLPSGQRLSLRRRDASAHHDQRPFLLVHGLSSNARLWDAVGARLSAAGHPVVALDQRGHGRSDPPVDDDVSYDAVTSDLEMLAADLGWSDVALVGQSWGGNVVLEAAARRPGRWGAIAAVDGGTIALGQRFATAEAAWAALEPPPLAGMREADIRAQIARSVEGWPDGALEAQMGNLRVHQDGTVTPRLALSTHRQIVEEMYRTDPADAYARIEVPVLLLPVAAPAAAEEGGWAADKASGVAEAERLLPDGRVRWFHGAHDIHLQDPDGVAEALLSLA